MSVALGFCILVAAGALLRFVAVRTWGSTATLTINVLGALALGSLHGAGDTAMTAIGVGGLGALTTVSGVASHLAEQLEQGKPAAAARYLAVTLTLGVGAAWLGLQL